LTSKFLTLFDIARQLSCPPHLTSASTLPCKTYRILEHGVYEPKLTHRAARFLCDS